MSTTDTVTIEYNGEAVSLPATNDTREQLADTDPEVAELFKNARMEELREIVESIVGRTYYVHNYERQRDGPWVRVTARSGRVSLDKGYPQDINNHDEVEIKMIRGKDSTAQAGVYVGFVDDE